MASLAALTPSVWCPVEMRWMTCSSWITTLTSSYPGAPMSWSGQGLTLVIVQVQCDDISHVLDPSRRDQSPSQSWAMLMVFVTLTWMSIVTWTRWVLRLYNDVWVTLCHLQAIKIVLDAKTDYPAACNAMETLLVHESLLSTDTFHQVSVVTLIMCPIS